MMIGNNIKKGSLVLFDMDGTLLRPDSWRENGVGLLYDGMADVIAPFVANHRCGLLTGCEVYRIQGALRATDPRLEDWLENGHFFCEMGLVQLENGVETVCATQSQKQFLQELRMEMEKNYDIFPGSRVMVTLTPRPGRGETIEGIRNHFLLHFPDWARALTVTTSTEAVDLMPANFTKAEGIKMALEQGYYPIHFVADSWGDMEALEMVRDEELGLAALVGQASKDVKERWEGGSTGLPHHCVQLKGKGVAAIEEFIDLLNKFYFRTSR